MFTKTISSIYYHYPVPINLQAHMLRTAALAQTIFAHWTGPNLNQHFITSALLLHDIGNLVKFELDTPNSKNMLKSNSFLAVPAENKKVGDQKDLNYWKKEQQKMIDVYGQNADIANLRIVEEIGTSQEIVALLHHHSFEHLPRIIYKNNWAKKIVLYCDLRITPTGLATVTERLLDLKRRYQDRNQDWQNKNLFQTRLQNSLLLENQLDQHTTISLDQIKPVKIEEILEQLMNYEIETKKNTNLNT